MRLAAVVDTRAEPGIANEFLGRGKARHVTNCGEHCHRDDDAEARQLHQVRYVLRPGCRGAEAKEFLFDFDDLGFEMIERRQVLADTQFLGRRELQTEPPGAMLEQKEFAAWRDEIVAMDDAVQAIARHCPHLNQSPPMRQQRA